MTRGKWVALAVGIAAIAALVPYGPELWRAVAYDPGVEERVLWYGSAMDEVRVGLEGTVVTAWSPRKYQGRLVLQRKRREWLPGTEFLWPDQVCPACAEAIHSDCFQAGMVGTAWEGNRSWQDVDVPDTVHCTCPHPSHAKESEQ